MWGICLYWRFEVKWQFSEYITNQSRETENSREQQTSRQKRESAKCYPLACFSALFKHVLKLFYSKHSVTRRKIQKILQPRSKHLETRQQCIGEGRGERRGNRKCLILTSSCVCFPRVLTRVVDQLSKPFFYDSTKSKMHSQWNWFKDKTVSLFWFLIFSLLHFILIYFFSFKHCLRHSVFQLNLTLLFLFFLINSAAKHSVWRVLEPQYLARRIS